MCRRRKNTWLFITNIEDEKKRIILVAVLLMDLETLDQVQVFVDSKIEKEIDLWYHHYYSKQHQDWIYEKNRFFKDFESIECYS